MWNAKKSLLLSKICVVFFMVVLLICAVFAPRIVSRLMLMSLQAQIAGMTRFLVTVYLGAVPAAVLFVCMLMLLGRIGQGRVFVTENTTCLRQISWCCFACAVICFVSALYYIPWAAIGVAMAFVGLIVRVVKNVIAKAVELQDEADFTV